MIEKFSTLFSGIFLCSFAFSGIYFLKFWRLLHDRFFLLFSIACGMIVLERIATQFIAPNDEAQSWAYLFRLVAFCLILFAIIDKNRARTPPPAGRPEP